MLRNETCESFGVNNFSDKNIFFVQGFPHYGIGTSSKKTFFVKRLINVLKYHIKLSLGWFWMKNEHVVAKGTQILWFVNIKICAISPSSKFRFSKLNFLNFIFRIFFLEFDVLNFVLRVLFHESPFPISRFEVCFPEFRFAIFLISFLHLFSFVFF